MGSSACYWSHQPWVWHVALLPYLNFCTLQQPLKTLVFSSSSRRKAGFWPWIINSTHFFEFHTWERHFACTVTVLALWSLQRLIKCSKRRFVPHVLRWDGDPMVGISPQILGGITPIQLRFLYKAFGGFISPTYQIFELSRLPKAPNSQDFPNLQTFKKLLKWPLFLFSLVFSFLDFFPLCQSPQSFVLYFFSVQKFLSPHLSLLKWVGLLT